MVDPTTAILRYCAGCVIIACAAAYRWLPMTWYLNSIVAGVLCQQAINIAYAAGKKAR